jgi:hypothetical protein
MFKPSIVMALILKCQTDVGSDSIKGGSIGQVVVLGTKAQPETVTREAGDDMQMNVKDFLTSSAAVGEVKIHTFAGKAGTPEGGCHPHACLEELSARLRIQ